MTDTTLTPSRLWRRIGPDQRRQVALAFWLEEETANDQLQAVLLISQQKKFRPQTVLGLDADRKAKHLASLSAIPDALAARALVAHHLANERPMMAAFLDGLGIAHEDGLIKDDADQPSPEKIGPAVAQIRETFPADSVWLYLNTLYCQDPGTWGVLAEHLEHVPVATQAADAARP
jgi:hypothetical protein